MAVGDPVGAIVQVLNGSSVNIQPPAGVTWVISNIYLPNGVSGVDIILTDGTNDIIITSPSGSLLGYGFVITNSRYIKIVNNSGADIFVGYDGFVVG